MRTAALICALTASTVWGQDATRVFQFHHVDKAQDLNEVGTLIRILSGIKQLAVDTVQTNISVRGTADQIAMAEWLFTELDQQTLPEFATKEFKIPNNSGDVARVFFLTHTSTVQNFQEIATAVRTIADMRFAFTYNGPRALAVRGTADQVAAVAWILREIDQPSGAKRTDSREYEMIDQGGRGETAVRVLYLPYASTIQEFQEATTMVRTIGQIQRVFTYNAPRAMVVRGTADQVAAADWMIHELGKPVTAEIFASPVYQMVDLGQHDEGAVRIFYVKDTPTVQAFQQVATQLRVATKIRRVYTYNASRAIALRGTSDQIAQAEQILKDRQIAAK